MGNHVQEVFQGRRDKKGPGFRLDAAAARRSVLARGIPLAVLFLCWYGLFHDYPVARPEVWFAFSVGTVILCGFFHLRARRAAYGVEFYVSLSILMTGAASALQLSWLRPAFFPLLVTLAVFYPSRTVIPVAFIVPLLRLRDLLSGDSVLQEIGFAVSLVASTVIAATVIDAFRKRRDRAVAALDGLKDSARSIAVDTNMESLGSDELTSHYMASVLKTDEEVRELLLTVKQAVFADSASLFSGQGEELTLRSSTAEPGEIIVTGRGFVPSCLRERKVFSAGEVDEKKESIGYIKNSKVLSLIAVPIMEGRSPTAVLTVDSSRYHAFSDAERNTVEMFARHLGRILERERIYLMIKRDIFGLRTVKEESAHLVSSLDTGVIAENLCGGALKIAPARSALLTAREDGFLLVHDTGRAAESGSLIRLEGTFANMAVENRQPLYVSDVAGYRIPIMPFRTGKVSSVLVIPLSYQNDLLGLFVMLSETRDFLDIFQIDLLKVMCNQASAALANAKLHAKIERMATTDGLTGLFNHRRFQELLFTELGRIHRLGEPVSLLLTDIDHFKKINDTYGHPVGDQVLKAVAGLIRKTMRDIDIPARYGGEEFAVILPGTSAEGAKKSAERLRKAVETCRFSANGRSFGVTISVGVSAAPADAQTKEELIEKTDRALYHAKGSGRNRSAQWGTF